MRAPREDMDNEKMYRETGFKKLFEDIRKSFDLVAKKSEKTHNFRRRGDEFFPNQAVWRRNFVLSDAAKYFSKKLTPQYIGPFLAKKNLSPWTYELTDKDGKPAGTWSAKVLKATASADEGP